MLDGFFFFELAGLDSHRALDPVNKGREAGCFLPVKPTVGESKVPLSSPLRWEKSQLVFVLGKKKKLDTGYCQCLSGKINLPGSSVLGLLTGESS